MGITAKRAPMLETQNIEIANIVASGKLAVELDLSTVAEDLERLNKWIDSVEHSRRNGNRLLINFTENDTLGFLVPSGVYFFTGAATHEEIEDARQKLLNSLTELGIISSPNPPSEEIIDEFTTQNIVCTATLGREFNLNAVAIGLGLEKTEYEPEQFPGIIYKPNNINSTILIFSTGKIIVTGVQTEKIAQEAFELLRDKLEELLSDPS